MYWFYLTRNFFQYDTSSSYENVKYLNMHQMIQITDDSSEFLSYSNSGKGKKKFFLFIAWCKKNKINNQVFFQKYICGHDKDGSIHSLVYLFHRCVNWEMLVKSQHVDNPTQICHNVLKLNLVFRDVWKYTFQNALRSFFSFWHLY